MFLKKTFFPSRKRSAQKIARGRFAKILAEKRGISLFAGRCRAFLLRDHRCGAFPKGKRRAVTCQRRRAALFLKKGGDPRCRSGAVLFMFVILRRKWHQSLKKGFHEHHLLRRAERGKGTSRSAPLFYDFSCLLSR